MKVKDGDALLDYELFAPILPIVEGVESLDEALAYVRKRYEWFRASGFASARADRIRI